MRARLVIPSAARDLPPQRQLHHARQIPRRAAPRNDKRKAALLNDKRKTVLLIASLFVLAAAASAPLTFPRDHGSHPDAKVEWWYYTGHLTGAAKREYGFQLTFFRAADLHLAHFAWTDVARRTFLYEEKSHLNLPGIASAALDRLDVTNEDWSVSESNGVHRLHARGRQGELDLELSPVKPPLLHGEDGISRKGPRANEYSHYVSITRFAASGRFRKSERWEKVQGTAWFDHEWGPGALPREARGWDWFAVQLDDGSELMLYRLRTATGATTPFSSGTFSPREGVPEPIRWNDLEFEETAFWKSPHSGARYPARWRIAAPSLGLDLEIEPQIADQELVTEQSTGVTYWEGTCRVVGTRRGRAVTGRAYAELTGYARRDVPGFAP
jgi:predicted secreted hydrolase